MKSFIDNSRFLFDKELEKQYNAKKISGSDEAGRGAMAGPIVVASVILKYDYFNPLINDSKKVSKKMRELLFKEIIDNSLDYKIKIYSNQFVDENNPKKTSQIGMLESIQELSVQPDLCLLDAEKININLKTVSIIKGDSKSQSIAAASILAKVARDKIMCDLALEYPKYNFEKHKGYCTKKHVELLKQNGVLECYRKTYAPVKKILEEN